ncbi:MAG TPA: undecaprenyl-phosphate galactose phosphotransferase WbaP [Acidobacteriaceae bacterium]
MAALLFSGSAAVAIRYCLSGHFSPSYYLSFLPSVVLFMVVFGVVGLYPGVAANPIEEFRGMLRATTITYLMIIGTTFFTKEASYYSRSTFILAWLITMLMLPMSRTAMRSWCARQPWWGIPAVILGADTTGQAMLRTLEQRPTLGLRPVAILDQYPAEKPDFSSYSSRIFWGDFSLAPHFASKYRACYAIIAMPHLESQQLGTLLAVYAEKFSHVLIIPDLFGMSSLWVSTKDMGGVLGLEISQTLTHRLPQLMKRCFDLVLAISLGTLGLPAFAIICLCARFSSPGPIFYGQRRIGRHDREFTAWKFRTMVKNADKVLEQHLRDNPQLREEWERDHKLKDDPRVTPIGRFLRKFSLDELPQLWNVLCGQMSLVGPRPIVWAEVGKYGKRFALYRRVPPGITGLWQISGRNNTTYEERTQLDEYYVRNWSVLLDFYILLRTFKTVLFTEGAY